MNYYGINYDNIRVDYDDLKQRQGTIDNYYDQYGNWWLVFVFTEETDDNIHTVFNVLDFKPATELK